MIVLYNIFSFGFAVLMQLISPFHNKARAFVTGRRNVLKDLAQKFAGNTAKVVWIHCASVGEFEQGRPVIEKISTSYPNHKILLTFFSPSGYELRKNFDKVFHVSYLPIDTASNAKAFVGIVKPSLAIFVKYEFWYHYARALKTTNVPLISISSIFRSSQVFFKPYGSFYREILKNFSFFFVQNTESVSLLKSIGIAQAAQAGDSRFDRVHAIVKAAEEVPLAARFKAGQNVLVVGSSWPEDMEVMIPFINEKRLKFIIAPHEIDEHAIEGIERSLQVKSVRYSQASSVHDLDDYMVLIIDNVGLLSRLYKYGEFAFVGGAFGKGLHNILEAACYGVPIFFGDKNYEKFQEAVDLINRGGAFQVHDYPDFRSKYEMINVPSSFLLACEVTRQYVEENLGATEKIMQYCEPILKQ